MTSTSLDLARGFGAQSNQQNEHNPVRTAKTLLLTQPDRLTLRFAGQQAQPPRRRSFWSYFPFSLIKGSKGQSASQTAVLAAPLPVEDGLPKGPTEEELEYAFLERDLKRAKERAAAEYTFGKAVEKVPPIEEAPPEEFSGTAYHSSPTYERDMGHAMTWHSQRGQEYLDTHPGHTLMGKENSYYHTDACSDDFDIMNNWYKLRAKAWEARKAHLGDQVPPPQPPVEDKPPPNPIAQEPPQPLEPPQPENTERPTPHADSADTPTPQQPLTCDPPPAALELPSPTPANDLAQPEPTASDTPAEAPARAIPRIAFPATKLLIAAKERKLERALEAVHQPIEILSYKGLTEALSTLIKEEAKELGIPESLVAKTAFYGETGIFSDTCSGSFDNQRFGLKVDVQKADCMMDLVQTGAHEASHMVNAITITRIPAMKRREIGLNKLIDDINRGKSIKYWGMEVPKQKNPELAAFLSRHVQTNLPLWFDMAEKTNYDHKVTDLATSHPDCVAPLQTLATTLEMDPEKTFNLVRRLLAGEVGARVDSMVIFHNIDKLDQDKQPNKAYQEKVLQEIADMGPLNDDEMPKAEKLLLGSLDISDVTKNAHSRIRAGRVVYYFIPEELQARIRSLKRVISTVRNPKIREGFETPEQLETYAVGCLGIMQTAMDTNLYELKKRAYANPQDEETRRSVRDLATNLNQQMARLDITGIPFELRRDFRETQAIVQFANQLQNVVQDNVVERFAQQYNATFAPEAEGEDKLARLKKAKALLDLSNQYLLDPNQQEIGEMVNQTLYKYAQLANEITDPIVQNEIRELRDQSWKLPHVSDIRSGEKSAQPAVDYLESLNRYAKKLQEEIFPNIEDDQRAQISTEFAEMFDKLRETTAAVNHRGYRVKLHPLLSGAYQYEHEFRPQLERELSMLSLKLPQAAELPEKIRDNPSEAAQRYAIDIRMKMAMHHQTSQLDLPVYPEEMVGYVLKHGDKFRLKPEQVASLQRIQTEQKRNFLREMDGYEDVGMGIMRKEKSIASFYRKGMVLIGPQFNPEKVLELDDRWKKLSVYGEISPWALDGFKGDLRVACGDAVTLNDWLHSRRGYSEKFSLKRYPHRGMLEILVRNPGLKLGEMQDFLQEYHSYNDHARFKRDNGIFGGWGDSLRFQLWERSFGDDAFGSTLWRLRDKLATKATPEVLVVASVLAEMNHYQKIDASQLASRLEKWAESPVNKAVYGEDVINLIKKHREKLLYRQNTQPEDELMAALLEETKRAEASRD